MLRMHVHTAHSIYVQYAYNYYSEYAVTCSCATMSITTLSSNFMYINHGTLYMMSVRHSAICQYYFGVDNQM